MKDVGLINLDECLADRNFILNKFYKDKLQLEFTKYELFHIVLGLGIFLDGTDLYDNPYIEDEEEYESVNKLYKKLEKILYD